MRTSRLLRQLAWRGLQANRDVFVPYTLALILIIALFNVLASLGNNEFVRTRGSTLVTLMQIGQGTVALFAAVFVTYARSFVNNRRRRELALYSVLGLEKSRVARILFWETLMVGGSALASGLIVAALFGNLAFMGLNALLRLPIQMGYTLSWPVTLLTAGLFAALFLFTWLLQVARLTLSTPMQQLAAQNAGEREPKANLLVLLAGLTALGAGYGLSLTTTTPLASLFIAIVLVVIGTYGLFTAGSIYVLRALRANRRFYYRPQAFIATSGMLYRMRQNATGLANIAVLLTMIVVTLATTATIFIGSEAALRERYPHQNQLILTDPQSETGTTEPTELQAALTSAAADVEERTRRENLRVSHAFHSRVVSLIGRFAEGGTFTPYQGTGTGGEEDVHLRALTAASFNASTGAAVVVAPGEAIAVGSPEPFSAPVLTLGKTTLQLHPLRSDIDPARVRRLVNSFVSNVVVIVSGDTALEQLRQAGIDAGASRSALTDLYSYSWETNADPAPAQLTYARSIRERFPLPASQDASAPAIEYRSRSLSTQEYYALNGGFLFVGIFLGMAFAVGAVLITYFKQVSEGHADRRRFKIMTQVGLDPDTVRRTTNLQLVWMFLLPLAVAGMHALFAFPLISQLLVLFGIFDARPFLLALLGIILIVGLLYYVVYRLTSGVYLRIVQGTSQQPIR